MKSGGRSGTIYFTRNFICFIGKRKWRNDYIKVFRPTDIIDITSLTDQIRLTTPEKKYILQNFSAEQKDRCLQTLKRCVFGLSGNTPLHNAVQQKNFDDIKTITDQDIELLKQYNFHGQIPLQIAVTLNHLPLVNIILEYYRNNPLILDINQQDEKQKNTVLHVACSQPHISAEIITALLKVPDIDVNRQNAGKNTPLHFFCEKVQVIDCTQIGEILLDSGTDLNALNIAGETPLHKAVMNPTVRLLLVDFLLEKKADINVSNFEHRDTPLHYAVRLVRCDLVEKLLSGGADITIENAEGLTPSQLSLYLYSASREPSEKRALKNITSLFKHIDALWNILEEQQISETLGVFVSECLYEPDILKTLTAEQLTGPKMGIKLGKAIKLIEAFSEFDLSEKIEKLDINQILAQEQNTDKFFEDNLISFPGYDPQELRDEFFFDNNLELNFSDLEFANKIGSGKSGLVFRGYFRKEEVAIKVLNAQHDFEEEIDEFKKELLVLVSVNSPYIIKLFGATLEPHLCMVMELCSQGNVYEILKEGDITWETTFSNLTDITYGLKALHDANIVHRDLKSLNMLVHHDGTVKICDFGLSRSATKDLETFKKLCGTFGYCAPEVFNGGVATTKGDIFSFGVVLWEYLHVLLTGNYIEPYSEFSFTFDFQIIVQTAKGLRPNIPVGSPSSLVDIYLTCVHPLPERRPDADGVLFQVAKSKESFERNPEQFFSETHSGNLVFEILEEGEHSSSENTNKIKRQYDKASKNTAQIYQHSGTI